MEIEAVKGKFVLEVETEQEVRDARPDFDALREIPIRGLMLTAPADAPTVDFVSRYFAPWIGIDEDPVTGSAHCALGPYWGLRLGKRRMVAHQLSARGGVVMVGLEGDRVTLGGQAVTVFAGELRV